MFLRNCWYAAAWDDEVSETPLGRTHLGRAGGVVPHPGRAARRSRGPLLPPLAPALDGPGGGGDPPSAVITGSASTRAGNASAVAGGSRRSRRARGVRVFPLVERYGWVWIWMGDPDAADPASVPDWRWM